MTNPENPAKDIIEFILRTMEERRQSYPKYSLRAMAEELDVNPGILSSVIAGTRKLTYETATQWLDRLNIDPLRRNVLLTQMSENASFQNLTLEQSEKIGLLEYAILAVLEVRSSALNMATIVNLLEKDSAAIRKGIENLQSLGWVSFQNDQVQLLKLAAPKAIYTMSKYENVIKEALAVIEQSRQAGTWLQGLSNTFSFVSTPEHIRDNYSKYMKAIEGLKVDFEQTEGSTLYQGLCFMVPVGKSLK